MDDLTYETLDNILKSNTNILEAIISLNSILSFIAGLLVVVIIALVWGE